MSQLNYSIRERRKAMLMYMKSVFLLCLVIWLSSVSAQDGDTAPDFRLINAQGEVVQLSDFFGTPLVLNIWATWCPPCVEELPLFQQFYDEYSNSGELFNVLLVNNNEDAAAASAFLQELGVTLPSVYDASKYQREQDDLDKTTDVIESYRVRGMPSTYFIDAEGAIAGVKAGFLLPEEAPALFGNIGVDIP